MPVFESAHDRGVRREAFRFGVAAPAFCVLLTAGAVWPAPAAGQRSLVLAGNVGSSIAAPGGVMVGLAGEVQEGLLGLRLGGSMDAAGTALAPVFSTGGTGSGAWSADVDAGLNVGRIPYVGVLFGRWDPSVFLGAGLAGVGEANDAVGASGRDVLPTWTWGARGGLPLVSWLRVELEARHREAFGGANPDPSILGEGWEYRVGLALRFGGGTTARAASGTRSGRGTPTGRGPVATRPVGRDVRRTASAEEVADQAIRTGERYLGTPYRWGGDSPSEGFDCSGFVRWVFAEQGIALPRVSRDQARAGRALPTGLDGLARGDLLFFAQNGTTVDHVAIYAGDGRILHSSSSGSGVRYDDLSGNRGRWYAGHLVAVRRVIEGGAMLMEVPASGRELPQTRRALPLDEAFEALEAERGDAGAPPPGR